MIKGLKERKGDVAISTVIFIVIGVFVLVMVIIGFIKGWDFIFGKFDNAPSELQTLALACEGYAKASLGIDFCNYRLIGNELVNCRDSRILQSLTTAGVNTGLPALRCDNDNPSFKQTACKTLASGKYGSVMIGEVTCASLLCTGGSQGPNGSSSCSVYDTQEKCQAVTGCTWQG